MTPKRRAINLSWFFCIQINNRKRDSKHYQSFVGEDFISVFLEEFSCGFSVSAIFYAVFRFLIGPYAPSL